MAEDRDEQGVRPEDALGDDELESADGEVLPEREAMSVIDLGEGGGLGPPAP